MNLKKFQSSVKFKYIQGCQNPVLKGHIPTWFSDLPGRQQKTRLDHTPRGPGSDTTLLDAMKI